MKNYTKPTLNGQKVRVAYTVVKPCTCSGRTTHQPSK